MDFFDIQSSPLTWSLLIAAVVIIASAFCIHRLHFSNKAETEDVTVPPRRSGFQRLAEQQAAAAILQVEQPPEQQLEQPDEELRHLSRKEQKKMEMKKEKKMAKEQMAKQLESKRQKEKERIDEYNKKEKEKAEAQRRKEAEEKKEQDMQRKLEEEEYRNWKAMLTVEAQGSTSDAGDEEANLYQEFISYIRQRKVVPLEETAAEFKLSTKDVISRIQDLEKDQQLSGIFDERGKYIYVSEEQMDAIAAHLNKKGRFSKGKELVAMFNRVIKLEPDEDRLSSIREEDNKAIHALNTFEVMN